MRIPSADIPQADVLDEVVRAVEAVGAGAHTFGDIAEALGKVNRQGRYYRRAGEILGFLHNVQGQNHATLTTLGRRFIKRREERNQILAQAVLGSHLIQRVIPFFEGSGEKGISRTQLQSFIKNVTEPVGETMIPRRASTVTSWLEAIGMLREEDGKLVLDRKLPKGVDVIEYADSDEPLSPPKPSLDEYKTVARRVRQAEGFIQAQINSAARERAEDSHKMLTNLVASKIREAGGIPKQNKYVDLSTALSDSFYLFEMKSTTNDNAHSQVRRAISQLYEYRYIQQVPEAKLVVVIENPLPQDKSWLIDYMIDDRELKIVWDGDGANLYCPDRLQKELGFLVG